MIPEKLYYLRNFWRMKLKKKQPKQKASTLPLNTMLFLKSFYVTILHYDGKSSHQ